MSDAIVANALVKTYGPVRALDGLDLRVPEGTVCGLLGPNGAGKTTSVRILATPVMVAKRKRHPFETERGIGRCSLGISARPG